MQTLLLALSILSLSSGSAMAVEEKRSRSAPQLDTKTTPTRDWISELQRLANAGDTDGAYCLGMALIEGDEIAQDVPAGIRWLTFAAERNHPSALGQLGELYSEGNWLPKDEVRALEFYQRGAKAGDLHSQQSLGWAYRFGRGCERDFAKARFWYEKAAEAGWLEAQLYLVAPEK